MIKDFRHKNALLLTGIFLFRHLIFWVRSPLNARNIAENKTLSETILLLQDDNRSNLLLEQENCLLQSRLRESKKVEVVVFRFNLHTACS